MQLLALISDPIAFWGNNLISLCLIVIGFRALKRASAREYEAHARRVEQQEFQRPGPPRFNG